MANSFIKPLYRKVYDEDFDYSSFEKRMKMQKCIYLIEQFGLNVGEYDFSWYKHGPYSQRLQDDMYEENGKSSSELYYSEFALNVLDRIRTMANRAHVPGFGYSEQHWMECLASVHYLNRLFQGDRGRVLFELIQRKSHLNNDELNNEAYDWVTSMVATPNGVNL